jgi:pilus assembly protein Flp/PilA
MIIKAINMLQSFRKEEDGLALTEYLILLALLTGAVIGSVLLIGENLGVAWTSWSDFFADATLGYTEAPAGEVVPD